MGRRATSRRYVPTSSPSVVRLSNPTTLSRRAAASHQTPEPPSLSHLTQSLLPTYPPLDPTTHSYHQNITGFLNGPLRVYNLSSPSFLPSSLSWAADSLPWAADAPPSLPWAADAPPFSSLPWAADALAFRETLNLTRARAMGDAGEGWNWTASSKGLSNLREYRIPGMVGNGSFGGGGATFFRVSRALGLRLSDAS